MFAVVKTGGKQYRVAKDDVIKVERLDAEPGEVVALDDVLMVSGEDGAPKVGAPALDDAVVEAEVLRAERTRKIIVFKKKRRQNYRRRNGHRQHQTVLKVVDISLDGPKHGGKAAKAKTPAGESGTAEATPKKATAKKTAAKKAAAKKGGAKADAPKKATAKKTAAKKAASKKATTKKAAAKKPDGDE